MTLAGLTLEAPARRLHSPRGWVLVSPGAVRMLALLLATPDLPVDRAALLTAVSGRPHDTSARRALLHRALADVHGAMGALRFQGAEVLEMDDGQVVLRTRAKRPAASRSRPRPPSKAEAWTARHPAPSPFPTFKDVA